MDGLDAARRSARGARALGVLSDARGLYARLTARENIAYYGELRGLDARARSTPRSSKLRATGST